MEGLKSVDYSTVWKGRGHRIKRNCREVGNYGQMAEIRNRVIPDDIQVWTNTQWSWSSGKSSAEEVTLSDQGEGET